MSALSARHIWRYRLMFLVLALTIITLRLIPIDQSYVPPEAPAIPSFGDIIRISISRFFGSLPPPDLLLALTFAWMIRQPAVVPLGMLLVVFLLADFLFQRPPGLWTLLIILASESIRTRRLTMAEFPFLVEWGVVAGAIMGMVLLNRLVLWILLVDLDPLGLTLLQGIVTIVIYPIVVAVSKFVFGLRKLGPTELEAL
ncbi:rod shape-determining protein MreD [Gymnodinialimonas hymeniacidonis]|uniref:rod shape-determining protein MreD n=1 Tax=Gymnodinialimonas hymeniacidonis TaxID=3126508 RepID=UPI0034C65870